jgi:hypothetical protein
MFKKNMIKAYADEINLYTNLRRCKIIFETLLKTTRLLYINILLIFKYYLLFSIIGFSIVQ